MKKLTIEHLAPYLPYKLKYKFEGDDNIHEIIGLDITDKGLQLLSPFNDFGRCNINWGKPILRQLSDLTKEIDHNGKRFIPVDIFFPRSDYDKDFDRKVDITSLELAGAINFKYSPYFMLNNLFEWHFDVSGLIDAKLAIDINTLTDAT